MEIEDVMPIKLQRQRERVWSMGAWSVICLLAAALAWVCEDPVFIWINCWISGFCSCITLYRLERYLQMQVDAGVLHHRN